MEFQKAAPIKPLIRFQQHTGHFMITHPSVVRRLGVVVQPTTFRRSATSIRTCDHVHLRLLSRKNGLGGVRECGAWRPD